MSEKNVDQFRALASLTLQEAYYDFILSRQASRCSPATMEFYKYTSGKFISWLESQGINSPLNVSVKYVREYIALQIHQDKAGNTVHDIARVIKTLLRFWHNGKYIDDPVIFSMPKVEKKRLPCLSAEELETVIKACSTPRDKTLVLFLADSGLRRAEAVCLNWGDVEMSNGLVHVIRGKGGKARSAVIGAVTRRALLSYQRTLSNVSENAPLFQSKGGTRFLGSSPCFYKAFKKDWYSSLPTRHEAYIRDPIIERRHGCSPSSGHPWSFQPGDGTTLRPVDG